MTAEMKDLSQIGASEASRRVLDMLATHGHIKEQIDGYRLGIAVAIAHGCKPRVDRRGDRRNMFHVGTLDENFSLRQAIVEIYPEVRSVPNRRDPRTLLSKAWKL